VGDITSLRTKEGWIHLAIVLDLFARRIVGWSMDTTQAATLPMAALSMALVQRKPSAGLIFHSDQGTVYGSHDYRELLQAHGVLASMSRKGNCHDNAVAESFFSNLKNEVMHDRLFASREEARAVVNNYIEVYYNRQRLHQTLGYQTPVAVEAAFRVLN
jgi:transposase InsO family protein